MFCNIHCKIISCVIYHSPVFQKLTLIGKYSSSVQVIYKINIKAPYQWELLMSQGYLHLLRKD